MEAKIPLNCISNIDNNNYLILHKIKCILCNGIYYDPVISKKNNCIYCKDCFYKINNINRNEEQDISKLYNKLETKKLSSLYIFDYYCPLCLKKDINNTNKKTYTYDALMLHLITCENQVIYTKPCSTYLCGNALNIYLKDTDKEQNLNNILLSNETLEKEIERELLNIDYKEYKKYLKSKNATKNKADIKKNDNNTLKKELLSKKRKYEKYDSSTSNKSSGKKKKNDEKTNKKSTDKKNITNYVNKDLNYSDNNINNIRNNKDVNESSMMKELDRLLKEECNKNEIELVDICPHWKGTYKNIFSCCDKEYGCDECHILYESHHMVYTEDSLCLFCYQKFKGDYCPYCKIEKIKKRK